MSPPLTFTFSPQRTIRALRRCTGKWWLNELGGSLQHDQCFGTMRTIGRLRELGVSSSRWRGDEPEPRFPEAPVCTLLVVAGSSTCSGSHAGCAHGMCMVGSAVVACSVRSAQISRVRVMSDDTATRWRASREDRRFCTLRMIAGAHDSRRRSHDYTCWL